MVHERAAVYIGILRAAESCKFANGTKCGPVLCVVHRREEVSASTTPYESTGEHLSRLNVRIIAMTTSYLPLCGAPSANMMARSKKLDSKTVYYAHALAQKIIVK
jgi:hypothetical protein